MDQDTIQTPANTPKIKRNQLGKTKHDLDMRARKIAKSLIEGKTATQAAKDAGYSDTYATCKAVEIVNQPIVQRAVARIYEQSGITDEFLAAKHRELLNAKEIKVFNGKDGLVYSKPVRDNSIQLQAVRLAHQIKGNLDTGEGKSGAGISIDKCVMLLNQGSK